MKTRQKIRKTLLIVSFLLFPATFYYLSPYLIIDGTVKGIIAGSFIFFVLLFISSLLLGRAYCGWVCPAGGAQDLIMPVNPQPSGSIPLIFALSLKPLMKFPL